MGNIYLRGHNIFVFWFGSVWGVIYKAEPDYYGAMKRKNICISCIIRILEFESAENAESAAVSAYISVITPMHSLHSCTLHNAKVSKMPGGNVS